MNELKRIVEDMESVFADSTYPKDFLAAYDQMECLASHTGRETFLVQRKQDGETAVAACYDRSIFPFHPDISLLQELVHPGLPRYYGQYENDRMVCIVREYIDGETLNDYVRARQLTLEEVISLSEKLCSILEVLHTHQPPVVHRDIKPENIIVKKDGGIVLIDFDIARSVKENAENDTVFFGTRGYAPPEQYGFGQTDNRTDIFSFGVLLRWLVTGSARENKNIEINNELQKIIDRCTAFSPEARYENIGQVREALDAACKKISRQKPKRRIRPGCAVLLFLAGLLLFTAGFAAGRLTDWLRPAPKIVFLEPLIEKAARIQIGKEKGTLTEEDLSRVTGLYIYGTEVLADLQDFQSRSIDTSTEGPIRTLDDLKLLPNLKELHIAHQTYVDAAGIAGMTHLETVELKHMRISGAAPIGDAAGLKHAILFCTGLNDATALENCPWLETLDIGLNKITSLSQIGKYPNVKNLGLMWLEMEDINEIAEYLPKVQAVMLQHGTIKDLHGLLTLPALSTVYVLEEQADMLNDLLRGSDIKVIVTEN